MLWKFSCFLLIPWVWGENTDLHESEKDVISDLVRRLEAKDEIIKNLVKKVDGLENRIDSLTKTVHDLTSLGETVKKLETRFENINDVFENKTREIFDFHSKGCEHSVNGENTTENQHEPQLNDKDAVEINMIDHHVVLEQKDGPNEKLMARKRHSDMNLVAFFATASNHETHLGVGQNIVFDNVVTNAGNAYNPHYGLFVAPVSGTYVFSVTIVSTFAKSAHFNVVKNGVLLSNMYVGPPSNNHDTSCQTIIVALAQGDDFAVKNVDAGAEVLGGAYSTIAGFLLQENSSSPAVIGK